MQNSKDSFFSMDRLIEFGMGMAMSQQIAQSMNNMMAQMKQPPLTQNLFQANQSQVQPRQPVYQQYASAQQVSNNPAAFSQAGNVAATASPPPLPQGSVQEKSTTNIPELFYVCIEKEISGPFSGLEIARLVVEKKVSAETLIWKNGSQDWKKAQDFEELLALIALVPPKLPEQ
jgi:hypothetical protein